VPHDNGDVTLHIGQRSARIPLEEYLGLLANKGDAPTLDKLFVADPAIAKARFRIARDGVDESKPFEDPKVRWGRPSEIVAALQRRYRAGAFYLESDRARSRLNLENLPMIAKPSDVALLGDDSITDHGTMSAVVENWQLSGMEVSAAGTKALAQDVIILSGHNDAAFRKVVEKLSDAGAFKGKQLLLATCGADDSVAFHDKLLQSSGARAVLQFGARVNALAVEAMLIHIPDVLSSPQFKPQDLVQVIHAAIDAAKADPQNQGLTKQLNTMDATLVPQAFLRLAPPARRLAMRDLTTGAKDGRI
jgi:hypothetical protein